MFTEADRRFLAAAYARFLQAAPEKGRLERVIVERLGADATALGLRSMNELRKANNKARARDLRLTQLAERRDAPAQEDVLARNLAALAERTPLPEDAIIALNAFVRLNVDGRAAALARAVTKAGLSADETLAGFTGLDLSAATAARRPGPLLRWGLLRPSNYGELGPIFGVAPADMLVQALSPPNDGWPDVERKLLGEPALASLTLDAFPHLNADADIAASILQNAREKDEAGVNILLYGPPGTGKTELAKAIAGAVGLDLFAVGEADEDGDEPSRYDRIAALSLAQRLAALRNKAILLFDEMEDLLGGGDSVQGPAGRYVAPTSKVFWNRLLERSPTPVIWTSNRLDRFDPAIVRRMTYVIEVGQPPAHVRSTIWKRAFKDEGLKPDDGEKLAQSYALPAGAAAGAARAGRLSGKGLKAAERATRALARSLGEKELSPGSDAFDLGLVNADLDIPALITRLDEGMAWDGLTMCFYGPPGTGKSAGARAVAKATGLDVLEARASDVFSPYVGETEQKIAALFRRAEDEELFLIFDEADALIADRRQARHGWELSQVDEMLSWIERARAPFAACTNLLDWVDAAALRRFAVKAKFDFLKPDQARRAFTHFFGIEAPAGLDQLDRLAPGDFTAVRKRLAFEGKDNDPMAALEALRGELALKPGAAKPIGFGKRVDE